MRSLSVFQRVDDFTRWRRARQVETETHRLERDHARGYSIRYKYITIAYAGEVMIIAASLLGQYLLSRRYGHGDGEALLLMMMAPLTYAVIEMGRVPLAIAARTQRSWAIKVLAIIGIVFAAGVTTKSLSQLGEQMFHPRLHDVVRSNEALRVAEREQGTFGKRIADADEVVESRAAELKAVEGRSENLTAQLAGVAKPQCTTIGGRNSKTGARWSNQKCTPDPKGAIIQANLDKAGEDRKAATRALDVARAERAKLDRGVIDGRVSEARTAYRNAIMASQLHSFTAMFFAKDPSEVTEAEVHEFLRIFVFVPAILAAFASTLLACAAVQVLPEKDEAGSVDLPSDAGEYLLAPFYEQVIGDVMNRIYTQSAAAIATVPTPSPAANSAAPIKSVA